MSQASVPAPRPGVCWRRLAVTVLGAGTLAGLLLLAMLVVAYFLPMPMLVVPAAAATAAVVYVTDRSRRSETGPDTLRSPSPCLGRHTVVRGSVVALAERVEERSAHPWPTGRRRRAGTRCTGS